jgi:uncharacterized damage-inducible protein DinB
VQSLESRRDDLLEAFNKSVQVFLATAEMFPRSLVKQRPAYQKSRSLKPGEIEKRPFTATEIVFHMVDVELLWQYRIKGLLSGEFRRFQQMNPDKEALEKRYNSRNYERGLRELAMSRAETTRMIAVLTNDELMRTGLHSKYGEMNTINILETMEAHDRQHAAQLDRTLAAIA